jgi:hypothetical protein
MTRIGGVVSKESGRKGLSLGFVAASGGALSVVSA